MTLEQGCVGENGLITACHVGEKRQLKYDGASGRCYTAKDPIGFAGGDTNLYGYVVNNPVNSLDPWGLAEFVSGSIGDLNPSMQSAVPSIDRAVSETLPNYSEAVVVSTIGGDHNEGSAHYEGNAMDIRVWQDPNAVPPNYQDVDPAGWITPEQAAQCAGAIQDALGDDYTVINELTRPAGQTVWGGPHIHIQFNGN